MKKGIIVGWILTFGMLVGFLPISKSGSRAFTEDWIMPIAGLISFWLLPVIFVSQIKSEKRKNLSRLELFSLAFFVLSWLLSLAICWWLLAWISTGGL